MPDVTDALYSPALGELLANTRQTLLDLRGPHGHWEGELSSSALSTATAVIALEAALRDSGASESGTPAGLADLIARGRDWLARSQNTDGGWGDTLLSHSNISTTALVWAALAGTDGRFADSERRCEAWLERAAGSLAPPQLAEAIVRRYGADRTFSVPILTALALCGRLGPDQQAWKLVPSLPFDLAAFPHSWYARLKLPVVSYALPALIAIGQVGHARRPTWNPITRLARNLARRRTLNVLREIQPESGGYLEATPLTSFVVMSLVGAGNGHHAVVHSGVEFLVRSARADGSWPIDTNLATWVTTLAVNALSAAGAPQVEQPSRAASQPALGVPLLACPAVRSTGENSNPHFGACLTTSDLRTVLDWLLNQQLQSEHPYTHAAPGAWAWTDLTGGVPDADDTPGALLALWNLAGPKAAVPAAEGVRWLLDLQNTDGGIPTFCRGWGLLPFDRSSADLTAHALRAWAIWYDHVPPNLQHRICRGARNALRFLAKTQRPDGAWAPLWFGNQHAPGEENPTYGTTRVLLALATAKIPDVAPERALCDDTAAVTWLLSSQNDDGGWGGAVATPSSIEETALAVEALSATLSGTESSAAIQETGRVQSAISRGLAWLDANTNHGREFPPSPIGFYFAKLWYFERMYPVVYTLSAVGRAVRLNASTAPVVRASPPS